MVTPPGDASLSVATYFSSTHFGGNDVCKTKSRIDLFCKQRDHLLSVNLLQRSIRHSAAVGQEWPQQAAVRTGSEIYYLGHVQRRERAFLWVSSWPLYTSLVWLPHWPSLHEVPGRRPQWEGNQSTAVLECWVWGLEMTIIWVPSLEGAVKGQWMRYKDWLLIYKGQLGLPLYLLLSSTIEDYGLNWIVIL